MAENDENLNSDNDVFYALLCRTIPNTYNKTRYFFVLLYSVSDFCDLGGEISVPESLPRFGYLYLTRKIYTRGSGVPLVARTAISRVPPSYVLRQ